MGRDRGRVRRDLATRTFLGRMPSITPLLVELSDMFGLPAWCPLTPGRGIFAL